MAVIFNAKGTSEDSFQIGKSGPTITRSGANLSVGSAVLTALQFLGDDGSAGAPTYSFTDDPNTGFYSPADNRIGVTVDGTFRFEWRGNFFETLAGNSPMMMNETVSATNPGFVPHSGNPSSGIGAAKVSEVTIIASGLEGSTWIPFNGGVTQTHACDKTITAFAGGGIGAATVLRQSYNIVTTVATTGDSIRLPSLYALHTIIYIKNDGANSLDVFPNNAFDDLGQGDGNAEALAVGDSVGYIATGFGTTWTPFMKNSAVVIPDPSLLGDGSAGAPTYSFASDTDMGMYLSGSLRIAVSGSDFVTMDGADFRVAGDIECVNNSGGALKNEAASATNPTALPNRADVDSGIGQGTLDQLSFIAGGVEIAQIKEVVGANQFIVAPGVIQNAPATPSLAFGDGDTGFFEFFDDRLALALGGVNFLLFDGSVTQMQVIGDVVASNGSSYGLFNDTASATVPTFTPSRGDVDTGIGHAANDQLTLIAGGVQVANLIETSGLVQFIVPQQNNAGSPSIAFGDGNTGFYESGDNTLVSTLAGVARWQMNGNDFSGFVSEAPRLVNAAASSTVPNIMPSRGDLNTGIGHNTADSISLIAGGVEGIRLAEVNNVINITMQTNVGLTAFAGGGQGSATQLQGSYHVVSTVATTGDSVKLPGVLVGTQLHVKNDGANAMDVFPLSGDDLGAGTDTAVSVAAGASATFIGTVDNTTWTQFLASGGGGDVTKVGTPIDNEIGVWTGDGTLEGDTNLTWDGTNLALTGTTHIVLPLTDDAATPTLAFGDGDTGFYETSDDVVIIAVAGAATWLFNFQLFAGAVTTAGGLVDEAATATNPTLVPARNDLDTGIGHATGDQLSLIAGGLEMLRLSETGTSTTDQLIIGPAGVIGAEATPSLAFGDGDSGFFESVDDTLALSLVGVKRFEFTLDQILGEDGTNLLPTYSFTDDPDTGMYTGFDNVIDFAIAGARTWTMQAGQFNNQTGNSAVILAETSTATNPTFAPNVADKQTGIGGVASTLSIIANSIECMKFDEASSVVTNETLGAILFPLGTVSVPTVAFTGDTNTGMYSPGADIVGLSAGAIEGLRISEASSNCLFSFQSNVGLTADVGSAQGNGIILSSINQYSTVGTTGDAATLPSTFTVGTEVHIINDGVNSMDVFPASGDDAGAGTDTAVAVAAGARAKFLAITANATWATIYNA